MDERAVSGHLSKSLFLKGRQCHKALWLRKHSPELADAPDRDRQARFAVGHMVGTLAQQLFPGGIEVPYDGLAHAEQVAMTRRLLAEGRETIYEAAFRHDAVFVKVDLLHRGAAGWEIFEVKASTAVEEVHRLDAAIQLYVVAGAGLPVARVAIVHVDTGYVRRGGLDVQRLFTVVDITDDARRTLPGIPGEIVGMRAMLAGDMPAIDIGEHCTDPHRCDFHGHCWRHVPDDSVFDLRGRGVDPFALYRRGIVRQADIPPGILNARQRQQVEATLARADHVDRAAVRRFLDGLRHPLCFLDFETASPAIPLFDGMRPYQRMPFQYSLRIETSPGSAPEHHEFLAQPGIDPRRELTDRLLSQVPEEACVIAWNQGFEKGTLAGLADLFPDRATRIEKMLEGFRDPMALFRDRRVYFWRQKGSYSIKDVLPVLVPELTYDGMAIAGGDMAMDAYEAMCAAEDPQELARIRKALLEYCALDTLGLVRIVERLRDLAG